MQKKSTTPSAPKTAAPDYGSFNSYQLTDEQVREVAQEFADDLMQDSDTDRKASAFFTLLRSFTYATDSTVRQNMLVAAEEVLMPHIGACHDALDAITIKAHQAIIKKGGVQ